MVKVSREIKIVGRKSTRTSREEDGDSENEHIVWKIFLSHGNVWQKASTTEGQITSM
jgi:hypothetical protein